MIPYKIISEIPLGIIEIKTWGLMVALGIFAGYLITRKRASTKKIPLEHIDNLAVIIILSAIAGARLWYVILFWESFKGDFLSIFRFHEGGLVFLGGFLGALIAGTLYVRAKKLSFWRIADLASPGLALGYGIGRLGCYLTGLHVGKLSNFFLSVDYFGESRIQTAMFSSLAGFFIYFLLRNFEKKLLQREGLMAITFMLLYSMYRFFTEFLRAEDLPDSDPRFLGLTITQYLCLFLVLISPLLFGYLPKSEKRVPEKKS